jgi:hypothetical protein
MTRALYLCSKLFCVSLNLLFELGEFFFVYIDQSFGLKELSKELKRKYYWERWRGFHFISYATFCAIHPHQPPPLEFC